VTPARATPYCALLGYGLHSPEQGSDAAQGLACRGGKLNTYKSGTQAEQGLEKNPIRSARQCVNEVLSGASKSQDSNAQYELSLCYPAGESR
jgi:hypothetical protein